MSEYLSPLLDWVGTHPGWAGFVLFWIALGESLAVVGLFVPGAVLMFGAGALIATGSLPFWPLAAWAAAGAVVGDGISFWLGRRFDRHLEAVWPFRRNPALLARAVSFFRRHGGKSVLLGRFIGPIRPVIPAVAGMLGMGAGRFFAINLLSALLWAPAYLLPGMAFAASMALAAAVLTRLLILVVGVGVAAYLLYRITHRSIRRIVLVLAPFAVLLVGLALTFDTLRLRRTWDVPLAREDAAWRAEPWQGAPPRRLGLVEGEPFELQVVADREQFQQALTATGWRLVEPEATAALLGWLSPEARASRLAPLPRLHLARMPGLVALRPDPRAARSRWVLRAWPSAVVVGAEREPLWLVSVERETLSRGLLWIQVEESPETGERLREAVDGVLARVEGAYASLD